MELLHDIDLTGREIAELIAAKIRTETQYEIVIRVESDLGYSFVRAIAVPKSDDNWESASTSLLGAMARISEHLGVDWCSVTHCRNRSINHASLENIGRWSPQQWWRGAHPPKPDVVYDSERRGTFVEMVEYRETLKELEEDIDVRYSIYTDLHPGFAFEHEGATLLSTTIWLEGSPPPSWFSKLHRVTEPEKDSATWYVGRCEF